VSIGRRELVAARGWLAGARRRRGSTAPRTATGEGLFAARERASGAPSRAALRTTPTEATVTSPAAPAAAPTTTATPTVSRATKPATRPAPSPAAPAAPAPSPKPAGTAERGATPAAADPSDTMARLREAKRRARER
jgi:hypothetical protein